MIPLVEACGLAIGHGGKTLIEGIDLALMPGRVLCLLGPNGTGKTTLFRTLLGLIPPIRGHISVAGLLLAGMSRVEIARHIAHVPQSLATPFAFTALDIVLMGAAARLGPFSRPGPVETERAMAALSRLDIADLANAEIARLSGGQRQLVLIARALSQDAGAIVMDEPTASLDFSNRLQVNTAVRGLAESGTAIVLSTHDPDQAAHLGDEALLLNRRGVIASGPVRDALTTETLTSLYGIQVHRDERSDGRLHFY